MTMRRPVLSTIIDRNSKVTVCKNGIGIVDGGASGHVMVKAFADDLYREGLLTSITPCQKGDISISWGDGQGIVTGIAQSDGLMQNVYIVETMSTELLISEHRLCEQGIIFVKNSDCLIGLQHGIMVMYAKASPLNPGENPLWLCDIQSLFMVRPVTQPSPTSIPIVQYLTELLENATMLTSNDQPSTLSINGARPTYTPNQVREGRLVLQLAGNISGDRIAELLRHDAIDGVPDHLNSVALWRALQQRQSINPAWCITKLRNHVSGGTGIPCNIPGQTARLDGVGPIYINGYAIYLLIIMDEATMLVIIYILSKKKTSAMAVKLYQEGVCRPAGHELLYIRSDPDSVRGAAWVEAINNS